MNQKKKNVCCLSTCKGEHLDLIHRFPRHTERALKWLEAIDCPFLNKIPLRKLSERYHVCSRHFRTEDYKHSLSRSLNMTAIPSLNLKDLSQLHLSKDSTPRNYKSPAVIFVPELLEKRTCAVREEEERRLTLEEGAVDTPEFESMQLISIDEIGDKSTIEECIDKTKLEVEEETLKSDIFSTFFEISHPGYESKLTLNSFWLRCNCRCSMCYDPATLRRKINVMDIPNEIQPESVEQVDGLDVLSVEWNDGHVSMYDINFLFNLQTHEEPRTFLRMPWHILSDDIQEFQSIEFNQLVSYDEKIKEFFQNLSQLGVALVDSIPVQNKAMSELVVCRLFPQLETAHFRQFTEIHSEICTNITYSNAGCGLKCFFATEIAEIVLVDGLNVAHELKVSNENALHTLSQVAVPLEINDSSVKWKETAPTFEIDPETEQVTRLRLDVHRMGVLNTIPQIEIEGFYDSLRQMIGIIQADENQWVLPLKPGTMVVLDNWRILHKISGSKGISQCYLERKDFISRLRHLGLM